MLQPYDFDPYQVVGDDQQPELPDTLETIVRFCGLFCFGVAATFIIRLIPLLQPLYWLVVVLGLVWMAIALWMNRSVRLIALALLVVAATVAGHYDGLVHGATQTIGTIERAIR